MNIEEIVQITKAQQLKDIIEPIPAEAFCSGDYDNNRGQCCFIGHVNKALVGVADPYSQGEANTDGFGARQLTAKFLREVHGCYDDGAEVNNNPTVNGYTEPIIKDRLMHMINDMIEKGY